MLAECYLKKGNVVCLQRTMGYIFRFFSKLKERIRMKDPPPLTALKKGEFDARTGLRRLTVQEREGGLRILLRDAHQQGYPEEMRDLKAGRGIRISSRLIKLTPFLDENGLICVGGRL